MPLFATCGVPIALSLIITQTPLCTYCLNNQPLNYMLSDHGHNTRDNATVCNMEGKQKKAACLRLNENGVARSVLIT